MASGENSTVRMPITRTPRGDSHMSADSGSVEHLHEEERAAKVQKCADGEKVQDDKPKATCCQETGEFFAWAGLFVLEADAYAC